MNLTGNYTGSATVTFTIKKAANPMAVKGMKVKVKVRALGNTNYKPSVTKVVAFKIVVK